MTARRPIADILAELEQRELVAVFAAVAKKHDVLLDEVIGHRKQQGAIEARQELYAVLRVRGWSTPRIGALLGRNPSTVLEGSKRHARKQCGPTVVSIREVA